MKHLGKRVLSTVLALILGLSVPLTDLSAMQVYAEGSTESVQNEMVVESVTDDEEDVATSEDVSEAEDVQEAQTESEETISEEIVESEEEKSAEEAETEIEENVTEEVTTEEITVEETGTEEWSTQEEQSEAETDSDGDGFQSNAYSVNNGFSLSADEDGRLVVVFEDGVTEVSGNVEIPKEVKIIPKGIFNNNISVTKLTFEEDSALDTIEEQAFFGSSVTSIVFPKYLSYIGVQAFYSSELENIVFEDGGTPVTIGESGFAKNHDLKTVTTNGRLLQIGDSAFLDDRYLDETIDLTQVTSIGVKSFYGCESLDYIKIPDTVEVIGASAFENCKALGKSELVFYQGVNAVQFGTGVTVIEDAAFKGCTGLQKLILPENVEALGHDTFGGCTALEIVTIYNKSGEDPQNACNISLKYSSFPSLKGLVLEAYDGTAEDWVGIHINDNVEVSFKSLYVSNAIKIASLENGTITASKSKAKMGETITLTVTPKEGYVLQYGSLYYAYTDAPNVPVEAINTWEYSFIMPEKAITIYATFVDVDSLDYGASLVLSENDLYNVGENKKNTNRCISYSEEDKILSFSKPWQNVRIEVSGKNGKTPLCSQLVFTSSNTDAVTIDEKGNIRAVAPTTNTKITVAFADKENQTKPLTFTVNVGAKTYVDNVELDYKATKADIDYASDGIGEAAEIGYDIITYPASILNVKSYTIKVEPNGTDQDGDKLDVPYILSAQDNAIAKPKASAFTGSGSITIPKGALGETVVTVKVDDGSKQPIKKQFIVRIIDDTPRLVKSTIKVDPQSATGTFVDLVSVYDATPNVNNLAIYKKVVKKGETIPTRVDDSFRLNVVDNKVYLKALEDDKTKYEVGKEYKYANTYFIGGTLEGSGTEFYIPIPTLIVSKKDIKPTVKMSGKINLFYNGTASLDKSGKVTVKQNQKDLIVEECYLIGKEKTNGVNTDDDNAFTENFTVAFDKEKQTISIVRMPGDEKLSCYTAGGSKGKPVLGGKIRIKYEGYTDPFDIKITVPTETVKPSYKLSVSKITLNSLASGQEYDVSFIHKKTKKVEDLLLDETIVDLDKSDTGTTDGLIEEKEPDFGFDADEDVVHLKIAQPKNGKIVLILRQPQWEDQSEWNKKSIVKASVTVSASSKLPKAVLGRNTLSLNAACPDAKDYTTMKLNQTDAWLTEDQQFVASGKKINENLSVTYDGDTGNIVAAIEDGASVEAGTYSFTCVPKFCFISAGNDEDMPLVRETTKITVKVKVKDAVPYIKLNKTSFTLNANCCKTNEDDKYDYVTTGYSWSNLPSEYSDYSLFEDDKMISYTGKGTDYIGEDRICFEIDEDTRSVKIYVESPEKVVGSGNYKVEGLKLVKDDVEIPLKALSFKVKCQDKDPGVSVTAKGTINPLDMASKIVYTPKLTNINGEIEDVVIRELAEDKSLLEPGDEHFSAVHDSVTGKTTVCVKEGEQLENRTYTIQLYYELTNGNGASERVPGTYVTKDQKIVPKQTMPKLSVDTKSATFYAGDKSRTTTITVTSKTASAEITDIIFSSKTSKTLQEAFMIESYDKTTGEMVLRLKNSAFIKQNTEQILTFEIVCKGQLVDTTGRTFDVKVKVIK